MKKEIYLIGVGNYTEVVLELARDCGYEVKGLYHYNSERTGEFIMEVPIIGCTEDLYEQNIVNQNFAVTIGDNKLRNTIANKLRKLGANTPNLIHSKANVSKLATMGKGCFLYFNAILWTKSKIGNDCILSPNAMISHHAIVGNAGFVTSFSTVGAYCEIANFLQMGINSLILPKVKLGENCFIAAKANVTKSFKDNVILIGNPAKILRKNK